MCVVLVVKSYMFGGLYLSLTFDPFVSCCDSFSLRTVNGICGSIALFGFRVARPLSPAPVHAPVAVCSRRPTARLARRVSSDFGQRSFELRKIEYKLLLPKNLEPTAQVWFCVCMFLCARCAYRGPSAPVASLLPLSSMLTKPNELSKAYSCSS